MTMKDKDLLKLLQQHGWTVTKIKGSHHKLKKDDETIILAVHGCDMKIGLLKKILKQAGLNKPQ